MLFLFLIGQIALVTRATYHSLKNPTHPHISGCSNNNPYANESINGSVLLLYAQFFTRDCFLLDYELMLIAMTLLVLAFPFNDSWISTKLHQIGAGSSFFIIMAQVESFLSFVYGILLILFFSGYVIEINNKICIVLEYFILVICYVVLYDECID